MIMSFEFNDLERIRVIQALRESGGEIDMNLAERIVSEHERSVLEDRVKTASFSQLLDMLVAAVWRDSGTSEEVNSDQVTRLKEIIIQQYENVHDDC